MKIIIIGLGSIGKRHARIIREGYEHKVYALRSGGRTKRNDLRVDEFYSWGDVEKLKPDVAFITNPTFLHIETALKCANLGCRLFIEKPIDMGTKGLNELIDIVKKKKLTSYVAYNMRFYPVIKELKKLVEENKPLYARVVASSYYPNWRPNTDSLKSYSANSDMGGGVILDLSHELDYTSYILGEIGKLNGRFSRSSQVTADAEDNADILVSSKKCPVDIHIDFLSHVTQRYIQIDFNKFSVIGDLIDAKVIKYKNGKKKGVDTFDYKIEDTYKDQMEYFFKNIDNSNMMNNVVEASELFRKIINFKNLM
jgi:predicted dehydrogenase